MVTSAAVESAKTVLDAGASTQADTATASLAWKGDREVFAAVPIYERIDVQNAGSASGTGDAVLGYAQVVRMGRLYETWGLRTSLPTGALQFSNARATLAPSFALSYRAGRYLTLIVPVSYRFDAGGTKRPFMPVVQELAASPRFVVTLPRYRTYASLGLETGDVTGEERYQSYAADATLGFVTGRFNVSATYALPISQFTHDHVFYQRVGFQLRWLR